MKWELIDRKPVESLEATLMFGADGSAGISIASLTPHGVWRGAAVFPPAVRQDDRMQHAVAVQRFKELETEVDVEDLLREWGATDGRTVVDFIVEVESPDDGLGEDLPQFHVPDNLDRGIKKKKKLAKRKLKVTSAEDREQKVPYAARDYPKPKDAKPNPFKLLPLKQYDHIVVSFSGGKDSVACVLYLLELGVPAERIELWHQAVDGRPGVAERLWDWPCTESYCEAFAEAFGMRLLYQWKDGGYLGELLKLNKPTAASTFQLPDGGEITTGGHGPPGTRLAYPAMSADLRTRWCSPYVKIDVAKKVFTNDPRFAGATTLFLTGERREESKNRSTYSNVAQYSTTQSRTVHQWRAVLGWFERDVWEIIERYNVRPHPAYDLGWSRVSCLPCIFGNPDQWAAVGDIAPDVLDRLARLEDKFHIAAQEEPSHAWSRQSQTARGTKNPKVFDGYLRTGESLTETAARGTSYVTGNMRKGISLAMGEEYDQDVIMKPGTWKLPVGAYKHSGGPT